MVSSTLAAIEDVTQSMRGHGHLQVVERDFPFTLATTRVATYILIVQLVKAFCMVPILLLSESKFKYLYVQNWFLIARFIVLNSIWTKNRHFAGENSLRSSTTRPRPVQLPSTWSATTEHLTTRSRKCRSKNISNGKTQPRYSGSSLLKGQGDLRDEFVDSKTTTLQTTTTVCTLVTRIKEALRIVVLSGSNQKTCSN